MKCGHCKSLNVTIDHVRACAGFTGAPDPKPQPVAVVNGPTDKQIAFINKLLDEKEHDFTDRDDLLNGINRKAASFLIEQLMGKPKKSKQGTPATLEDGIYEYENEVYRVYHTVHGANQQVVSLVNTHAPKESKKTDKFTYLGKAPLAFLRPEHKMPFDAACKIASAYEWCIACGTILHNDKSVELGIGPVCRGKFA
jgi:hypothetical protein